MARTRTHWDAALLPVLALLTAACSDAPSRLPSPAEGAPTAALSLEPSPLVLPATVPGGLSEGLAVVRNQGDETVEIIDMSAPCECTSAEPELPRVLAPGESFRFPVRFDLARLNRGGLSRGGGEGPEQVERTVTLWTRRGRSVELPMIVPLTERIEVDPAVTQLGKVERGSSPTARVTLRPGRRAEEPLGILSLEAVPGPVALRAAEVRSGDGVELELSLGPLAQRGPFEAELRVLTTAEPWPVRVEVRGEAVEPLRLIPEAIEVPRADPSKPFVTRIHLLRRDGEALKLRSASTGHGRIRLKPLGESPTGAQVVQVLIGVPAWPEEVRGEILLETDFPGEAGRLTLPVFLKSAPPR